MRKASSRVKAGWVRLRGWARWVGSRCPKRLPKWMLVPGTDRDSYTPRMVRVWLAVPVSLILVWVVVTYVYRYMNGDPFSVWPLPVSAPTSRDDALKNTITIAGLLAAVLTAVYAYRKQRIAEGASCREDAEQARADAVEYSRRYSDALALLGNGDAAAMRLGGAYAMARLADDWSDQRQTCIDVLCAYLRMPFDPDAESAKHREGENEVRNTIQRIIQAHVQPSTTNGPSSWSSYSFDFTGAHLQDARFDKATFSGDARFVGATFSGHARFNKATFSGDASFNKATFSGYAGFVGATFSGYAGFDGATFPGNTGFDGATFSGNTRFVGATFSGNTRFDGATFSGYAGFNKAPFRGDARFGGATFRFEPDVEGMTVERHPELNGVSPLAWPEPNRARRDSEPTATQA